MLRTWASMVLTLRWSSADRARLERPWAMRVSTARSRSVSVSSGSCSRWRDDEAADQLGVDDHVAGGDAAYVAAERRQVGDPVLEQVADAAVELGHQPQGVVRLDVLRQEQQADLRGGGPDRGCRVEALGRVGRWHPQVDRRRRRAGRRATRRTKASPSPTWPVTSKPASTRIRARPSRNSTASSASATRTGVTGTGAPRRAGCRRPAGLSSVSRPPSEATRSARPSQART